MFALKNCLESSFLYVFKLSPIVGLAEVLGKVAISSPFVSIFISGNRTQSESSSVNGDITASEHTELDLKDEQLQYFESDKEENVPYIDKFFSLSVGECSVHGEDAATSLKKQFFPLPIDVECLVSGKKSDVIKKPDCDIAKDKLEDSILLSKVEREELDCTEVYHSSSDNRPAKLSDVDTTFMGFVVTKGLSMEPGTKTNIVEAVMAQYSNKLPQIEDRIPKLGELLKEEEMALLENKKKLDDLEEEVVF